MFLKDTRTNTVINTDDSHYKAILSARSINEKNRILSREIDTLKNDLCEIRELLQKVLTQ